MKINVVGRRIDVTDDLKDGLKKLSKFDKFFRDYASHITPNERGKEILS